MPGLLFLEQFPQYFGQNELTKGFNLFLPFFLIDFDGDASLILFIFGGPNLVMIYEVVGWREDSQCIRVNETLYRYLVLTLARNLNVLLVL